MTIQRKEPTSGTMTAEINKTEFNANSGFLITRTETHWQFSANENPGIPEPIGLRFSVPLNFPDNEPTTYKLQSKDGPNDAWAYYLDTNYMLPSKDGSITITHNPNLQKLSGIFDFNCSLKPVDLSVKNGKFDLTGIVLLKDKAEQFVTADLKFGDISKTFNGTLLSVDYNSDKKELGLEAIQFGESHRISLSIHDDIEAGTHEFKYAADAKIRATYIDFVGHTYFISEGTLILNADPSQHHLDATLEFTAKSGATPEQTVVVSNGIIKYSTETK